MKTKIPIKIPLVRAITFDQSVLAKYRVLPLFKKVKSMQEIAGYLIHSLNS